MDVVFVYLQDLSTLQHPGREVVDSGTVFHFRLGTGKVDDLVSVCVLLAQGNGEGIGIYQRANLPVGALQNGGQVEGFAQGGAHAVQLGNLLQLAVEGEMTLPGEPTDDGKGASADAKDDQRWKANGAVRDGAKEGKRLGEYRNHEQQDERINLSGGSGIKA